MGDCPRAVSDVAFGFNNGQLDCTMTTGYSFYMPPGPPSSATIAKICANSNCQQVINAIKGVQATECTTSGGYKLYAQILNPIQAGCGAAPPATTPPPPTTTPPPPTTTPPPPTTAPPPATSTTTPAPATTAPPPATTSPITASPSETTAAPSPGMTTGDNPSESSPDGAGGSSDALATSSSGAVPPVVTMQNATAPSGSSAITAAPQAAGASSSNNTPIYVGIGAGVVVVALLVFAFLRRGSRRDRERSAAKNGRQEDHEPSTNATYVRDGSIATGSSAHHSKPGRSSTPAFNADAAAPGLWGDKAIQDARVPLEKIVLGDVLSRGAFGEVLRASYNTQVVAVKRLLPERRKDMKEIEAFLEEVKLMTTLHHQRIVRLIGVAWDSLTDLCVVSEFMGGGDLRTLLQQYDAERLPTGFNSDKINIALHIAHGLSYLHGLQPSILHRDLKSKNVLLTADLDAKLTDFGVSRQRGDDATMTAAVGSCLWMAPEVMMGERYDEKADVFSFGVVLSELDTQKLPYAHATEPDTNRVLPELAILQMISLGRLTVAFSAQADQELVEIARSCVSLEPQQRPSAQDLLHRLHRIWQRYRGFVH